MFRSILSIILGFILMRILSIVNITILFNMFPDFFPIPGDPNPVSIPIAMQVLVFILDMAGALFGGYFTAAIAIVKPQEHARSLAILVFAMGVVTLVTSFGTEPVLYAIIRFICAPAAVYLGGWLRTPKKTEVSEA